MVGIPRALTTDAEDVVWALQTAEALWKRFERADAIVWLRRAAQAAGDAEDDDRALTLASSAAELADWIARDRDDATTTRPAASPSASAAAEVVDDLLLRVRARDSEPRALAEDDAEDLLEVEDVSSGVESIADRLGDVPTAAETHAGMLDPWSDGNAAPKRAEQDPVGPSITAGGVPLAPESEGVVTSAPPVSATLLSPSAPPLFKAETLDLSGAEALSDLPDDARTEFARAATLRNLSPSEEVAGFGLAIVIEGRVHLTAATSDVVACDLDAGAIVRARGTIDHFVSLRLVAGSERVRVATWDEHLVEQSLRTCPWVEHELRAAGDRFQAEVGVLMGALGTRLDPMLRVQVMEKLSLRALSVGQACATRGNPVPGLLVVAAGELELVDDGIADGASLCPGDFLFPAEFLRAAPAPRTARAGTGGALVLMADRRETQELLVTCPPLLEIFGGG